MMRAMSFFSILLALLIEQVRPMAPGNPVHNGLRVWARAQYGPGDNGMQVFCRALEARGGVSGFDQGMIAQAAAGSGAAINGRAAA